MNASAQVGASQGPLVYSGRTATVLRMVLSNLLLTLLSLGLFHFWGRTRARRYLWANTRIMDSAFDYRGTGREGLLQYLRFIALVILPIMAVSLYLELGVRQGAPHAPAPAYFLGLAFAAPAGFAYARYGALRYRVRRTLWNDLSCGLHGTQRGWVNLHMRNALLRLATLGLYRPLADSAGFAYVVNALSLGDRRLCYDGDARDLQPAYYQAWLLALPTFGLSLWWYRAQVWRHLARHTRLDGVHLDCSVSGGRMLRLELVNLLIFALSLGTARALLSHRRLQLLAAHLRWEGRLDLAAFHAGEDAGGNEGAASFLGLEDFDV